MTKNKLIKLRLTFTILSLFHCAISARNPLDSSQPIGAIYQLLPFFFPGLKPSSAKEMKTYFIPSTGSSAVITGTKMSLIVPYSTDLSSLSAEFYHTGKSATVNGIEQITGQTLNSYSQALVYTITAANATQKNYTLSTAKGNPDSNTLFGFQFDSLAVRGVITGTSVTLNVPYGTNLKNLIPTFSHNGSKVFLNATEQVSGKTANDFTNPLLYEIQAENGSRKQYTIVVVGGTLTSNTIENISVDGIEGSITGDSIYFNFTPGQNVSSVSPIISHLGSTVTANGQPFVNGETTLDLTLPQRVKVISADGTVKEYTIYAGYATGTGTGTGTTGGTLLYTIGGSVSGLTGTLVLQTNGGDDKTISVNGAFTFTTSVANFYSVTVLTQPTGQTCAITNGTGSASADITNVNVSCATSTYRISGLVGGLSSGTLSLQNNGGDTINLTANGSFTFPTSIAYNNGYNVTVFTQPGSGQNCTVSNGSGTVTTGNISTIAISCSTPGSPTYTIGGTVSGLTGTVVLRNNGGNDLSISANGAFTFSTSVANLYSVTVLTQPTGQTCSISNASGTASANVTNVNVTCATSTFTIGGLVGGLTSGTLSLRNNGGDTINLTANGSFTFPTSITYNNGYNVTVFTQPGSGQNCTVSNGSGTVTTGNISTIAISCSTPGSPTYTIGGTISGLSGTVVLRNNGGNDLSRSANGAFTFSTSVANLYSVTVLTQPTGQTCTISNASGTASANVTNVNVTCATSTYTIGGLVGGLTSGTLSLRNNGGDTINLTANGSFTFPTSITYNNGYNVTVFTQPGSGQNCTVSNGSGTVTTGNISTIAVSCSTPGSPTYTIGGTISGLSGTVVLRNNGGNDLSRSANGAFTFSTSVANLYSVTVLTQPTGQTCTISNSSGTASANVTNVNVTCATSIYKIGGTLGGLSGGTLVLQNNGGDNKSLTANGIFEFTTSISHNGAYNVTVLTNPTNQFCSVTNGTGTATGTVTNIIVECNNTPGTTVQSFTDLGNQTIRDNNTGLIWMKCSMSEVPGIPLTGNCSYPADTGAQLATEIGKYIYCRENDKDCNGGTITGAYGTLITTGFSGTYPGSFGTVFDINPGTDHYIAYKACDDANSTPSGGFAGKTNWRVPNKDELESLVDYSKTTQPSINITFFPNTATGTQYWSSTTSVLSAMFAWYVDFGGGSLGYTTKINLYYVRCVSGP